MRILFYLHQFPAIGGIETVTATLANYLAAKGHSITIVSHKSKPNADVTVALGNGIDIVRMPDVGNVTRRNTAFLQRTILEKGIDVIVFQDSYAEIENNLLKGHCGDERDAVGYNALLYKACQKLLMHPFMVKVIWHLQHPFWRWRQVAHQNKRRCRLYGFSARYVLLSDRFFGEFKAVTHLWDTRKLRAIPNPLVPAAIRSRKEKLNEIVFASTLNWDKGIQRVLPIWKNLAKDYPDWRFTIVGDGEMMNWASRYIEDNRLERVSLEGYKPDCAEYFSRAKLLVYPSSRDGWGLILVEAMVNWCVPVAFDSYAAVRDIIDDGKNGVLVPAYDESAYERELRNLMSNCEILSSMADAAHTKAECFSIDNIGPQWDALLDEVKISGERIIVVEHSSPYYEECSGSRLRIVSRKV